MLAGSCLPLRGLAETPRLRVGVVSDIHVKRDRSALAWRRALEFYRDRRVDAVLVPGDLTTWSTRQEFEDVLRIWREVFPGDRLPDGTPVERLFVSGNHDLRGQHAEEVARWWQELFDEEYVPISVRSVKGYPFVLRHWVEPGQTSPMPAWFAAHGAELPRDRPFFYVQHEHPAGTCSAPGLPKGDDDEGIATNVLAAYPNAIAFSGHSHMSLLEERTIWQGAFTSVGCGACCGWAFTWPGRENGHSWDDDARPAKEMSPLDFQSCRQGLLMEVFDDRVTLERRDWEHGLRLGPDWVIPLDGSRPYRHAPRQAASRPPAFGPGASVSVTAVAAGADRAKDVHPQVAVEFPPVSGLTGGTRAFDFEVVCEAETAGAVRTVAARRVYSPNALQPAQLDVEPVRCLFAGRSLPDGERIRFAVRPLDEWGKAGQAIVSKWLTKGGIR